MDARRKVLLLNASGEPMGFVPWTRAINLVLRGKVTVYEHYEGLSVRSPSRSIPVPSVVGLVRYVVLPDGGRRVRLSKRNLMTRDRGRCQYCGKDVAPDRATVDHVMPLSQGGWHDWDNVLTACKPCNNRKGSRTPEEAGMTPLGEAWVPSRVILLRQTARKIGYAGWWPYLGMA